MEMSLPGSALPSPLSYCQDPHYIEEGGEKGLPFSACVVTVDEDLPSPHLTSQPDKNGDRLMKA